MPQVRIKHEFEPMFEIGELVYYINEDKTKLLKGSIRSITYTKAKTGKVTNPVIKEYIQYHIDNLPNNPYYEDDKMLIPEWMVSGGGKIL